jgi:hypothetical protein
MDRIPLSGVQGVALGVCLSGTELALSRFLNDSKGGLIEVFALDLLFLWLFLFAFLSVFVSHEHSLPQVAKLS